MCRILHADTAGTIPALAALVFKLTGNLDLASNVAVNSLVMNTDDVACAGGIQDMMVNQTIAINSLYFGDKAGEVSAKLMQRVEELCTMLRNYGIRIDYVGGETASCPNNIRTLDVGNSAFVRMERKEVIDASKIVPGDFIVGFASDGRASWEKTWNSGIGSNGLTSAVHDLLCPEYRQHKQIYSPEVPKKLIFRGKFRLGSKLPGSRMTVAEALLSPTRTYLPLIHRVLEELSARNMQKLVHGIIHLSGGGLTKMTKFGAQGNRYVIDDPLPVPSIFSAIQKAGTSWEEMYRVFNMGQRLTLVTPDRVIAKRCIEWAECYGIQARIIGRVESKLGPGPNKMTVHSPHGTFRYQV